MTAPGPAALADLTAFRRGLHRVPELSGAEFGTARRIAAQLGATAPSLLLTSLGGTGVAAVYDGALPGPTVLLRCELDALPIAERSDVPHRSSLDGCAHLCGHDGHMAIMIGVAQHLGRVRPASGRAVLLFQPAEETGAGAERVIADPVFSALVPDYAFALHNLPGLEQGSVALRAGPVNCASRGLRVRLSGREAHAAEPERGLSPADALAALLIGLPDLGSSVDERDSDFARVTVTHARLGAPAFGVAPGEAEIWVTLRTLHEERMENLCTAALEMIEVDASDAGLTIETEWHDVFAACVNDPMATAVLARAVGAAGLVRTDRGLPMRASEDFGRFGTVSRSAMVFLGAGTDHPPLHAPDYDFPDGLIGPGVRIFSELLADLLNRGVS